MFLKLTTLHFFILLRIYCVQGEVDQYGKNPDKEKAKDLYREVKYRNAWVNQHSPLDLSLQTMCLHHDHIAFCLFVCFMIMVTLIMAQISYLEWEVRIAVGRILAPVFGGRIAIILTLLMITAIQNDGKCLRTVGTQMSTII